MAGAILIAYATRYGSTEEVAVVVGERLRRRGLTVDVTPAREARSLGGYDAVVLATPFYIGSMLKEAREFLRQHQESLTHVPLAVLALGPTSAKDDMAEARAQLDGALAKMEWARPAVADMFVGKYDPARLRGLDKLVAALPASPLHDVPARDERDWAAIEAWAERLPVALRLES